MPRPGFLTPSSFADLMSNGRGKDTMGKQAFKVIDKLVLDMLGVAQEDTGGTPASCQWGLEHEWAAIQEYEARTFRSVATPVEFRISPTHPYVGGTMDGLVGKKGGIEVKSPYSSAEHLYNLQGAKQLYSQYMYQVQGYFWIFELEWIDFISYDPRFPEPNDLYIHRVEPDVGIIEALKARCKLAYGMAMDTVLRLRRGRSEG